MRYKTKKALIGLVAVAAAALVQQLFPGLIDGISNQPRSAPPQQAPYQTDSDRGYATIASAVSAKRNKVWFDETRFEVVKILSDDNVGSRHQRFLVSRAGLPTLLVAHNIDLAPRAPIQDGSEVFIRGRYEWNDKGGVIHWTHHDPKGHIEGGWINVNGNRYE